jgi:hypothetical protein
MSTFNDLKVACASAGVTGIMFSSAAETVEASVSAAKSIAEELAIIEAFTSTVEVQAYVGLVLAEGESAPVSSAQKAANKAKALLEKAGPSIADGGAVFAALFGVLKGIVKKCNTQLNKIENKNARNGAKAAAIIATIGITIKVIDTLTGFLSSRLKEHKKAGLKKKEDQIQKRLDKVKAQLDALEGCKKKAEAIK